jgi:small subunit ribosomal protein S3Ae
MSLGKNKKNFSKGRKGAKKKVGERFLKKEWWNVKAPGMFMKRMFTFSPVNQTVGKKLASEAMKGRVYEANLGDLNQGYESNKKIKLIVEDADGSSKIALTNFYGLDCTRDYLCSLIRKWHTLIDTFVDCKTNDGFLMRFFIVAFTAKNYYQKKAICYANRSQVRQMRAIMTKIITKECKSSSLKDLVGKVLGNKLTDEMTKKCKHIFPLENVTIRKVKSIKRPRVDMTQLSAMQADGEIAGIKLEKEEKQQ